MDPIAVRVARRFTAKSEWQGLTQRERKDYQKANRKRPTQRTYDQLDALVPKVSIFDSFAELEKDMLQYGFLPTIKNRAVRKLMDSVGLPYYGNMPPSKKRGPRESGKKFPVILDLRRGVEVDQNHDPLKVAPDDLPKSPVGDNGHHGMSFYINTTLRPFEALADEQNSDASNTAFSYLFKINKAMVTSGPGFGITVSQHGEAEDVEGEPGESSYMYVAWNEVEGVSPDNRLKQVVELLKSQFDKAVKKAKPPEGWRPVFKYQKFRGGGGLSTKPYTAPFLLKDVELRENDVLFSPDYGEIPYSVVLDDSDLDFVGDVADLTVDRSYAKKKGWK